MARQLPSAPEVPGVLETTLSPRLPDTIMAEEDQVRLLRLIRRTLGSGFKLAFVEAATRRDRELVLEWLAPALEESGARIHTLNLHDHADELVSEGFNLWALLHRQISPESLDPRCILTLWGFEEVMYRGRTDRPELLQQINVQRDILVRDYPCWWLLFVHPESRQQWYSVAPDFCDFASMWVETPNSRGDFDTAATSPSAQGTGYSRVPPLRTFDSGEWPPLLALAVDHLMFSRYTEALDAIHSFRAAAGEERRAPRDFAIADMLEAAVHGRLGHPEAAIRLLRENVIPVFERLDDSHLRAVAFGYLADILQQRGQTEEALRIRREEQLPVYERVGDVRARAVTLGQIADILQQRGQTEEALRILRGEVLPHFDRVEDVRERAITLGRIADILQQRGETEESLRILREEALPHFEQVGDVLSLTVTLGRIAAILDLRGETEEALRIFREEQLPVFERLGDVRERAVTLSNIAHILTQRGETEEALRILREEVLPVFEQLDDVLSRAITLGRMADILQQRGELEEALRIRREEELPVYERVGDVHARAVTLGQIAAILEQRGDTEEALRIHLEERLPMAEKAKDVDSIAHIRFSCARIRLERGGLEQDEVQTILEELAESFVIYRKLQRTDGIAVVGELFGQVLSMVCHPDRALEVLDQSAAAFERLRQPQQAARVRQLQQSIRETQLSVS
jgi:tetratricopeptide (TPR) repeat protein